MTNMTRKQKKMLRRIIVTAVLFTVLLILNAADVLIALPGIVNFILWFIPYLIIGYDVIIGACKNIIHGQVFDEKFLMMLASLAAFMLGLFGSSEYSEALAVMLFYQVGEFCQGLAVGKSRQSITQMMSIAPESANLEKDGKVTEVDPDDVHVNDVIVVRPGEKVPLDGVVLEGTSFLDTAALTGESVPRRVCPGDPVISGCVNSDTTLRIQVTKEYEDSTVARILDLVENASEKKSRMENFITRFARIYTPVVTIGAIVVAIILPLVFHMKWTDGIYRACNFLIVSCPCALVISVPLGFFGGIGAASKIGVLVKGSNYLEAAADLKTIVMDKTGTLTKGEFRVRRIVPAGMDENSPLAEFHDAAHLSDAQKKVLTLAALGEGYSTHPIAQSIRQALPEQPDLSRVKAVKEEAGYGICAQYQEKELLTGNRRLLQEHGIETGESAAAGTVVEIAFGGQYIGRIIISDTLKEGVPEAVAGMKSAGILRTVMLTGDRKTAAEAVAREAGIDEVHAQLLPADKVTEVEKILDKEHQEGISAGKTGFVGDGINDAPVLMRSDVGFAMGSLGSDAAIEAADIVIMDDDLRKIPKILHIARKTMRVVRSNVIFAIGVKMLILVLSIFGRASMWAAVFGDVGVALLCILNSMRVLAYTGENR